MASQVELDVRAPHCPSGSGSPLTDGRRQAAGLLAHLHRPPPCGGLDLKRESFQRDFSGTSVGLGELVTNQNVIRRVVHGEVQPRIRGSRQTLRAERLDHHDDTILVIWNIQKSVRTNII